MALASSIPKLRTGLPDAPWLSVAAAIAATALGALLLKLGLGLSGTYALKALAPWLVAAPVIARQAARHVGPRAFGTANRVTLARFSGVALMAGALGEAPGTALAWVLVGIGAALLILDGVDGRVARARGTASRFGARFDMETDTLLALVLALLVLAFDKAGPVVLVAGLVRYAFWAAGFAVPMLRRALPPSRRRQALCVVQAAALAAALVPWLGRPASDAVALVAVGAVVVSFAIDVRWLVKMRS